MRNVLKITIALTLSAAIAAISGGCGVQKNHEEQPTEVLYDSVTYCPTVTAEMSKTSYWLEKSDDASTDILMSAEEIETLNREILDSSDTGMYDLMNMSEEYDADEVIGELLNTEIPDKDLFVDGEAIDKEAYFANMLSAIENTGYSGKQKVDYAVCVNRADIKGWPTDDVVGYSETDTDDELINTAINVNEPFVIQAKCEYDGQQYYWGYCNHYSGWINGEKLAICESKEQWIDAWNVDVQGQDFLVVTQDKIVLEPSQYIQEISQVSLMLGTTLKLVPEQELPKEMGERGLWNNYVIYLPTRDADGRYVKQYASIPQHESVSIGFLPMTQENVIDIAFSCLGDRYGWGGMLGSMDCSLYTRSIYHCFGLELPRDTGTQASIPGHTEDISEMTDDEKNTAIEKLPIGSILFFPGHVMVYIGSEDGVNYAISATGSVAEPGEGDAQIEHQYSVIINPLTARRRDSSTWLSNLQTIISFGEK